MAILTDERHEPTAPFFSRELRLQTSTPTDPLMQRQPLHEPTKQTQSDLLFRDEQMSARYVFFTLLLCAFWGGIIPAIKVSLSGLPPLATGVSRFFLGLLFLLVWCFLKRIPWRLTPGYHGALLLLGLIFVIQISALNLGTRITSSSHAAVFVNTSPLFIAFLAHFLIPNDRLNRKKMSGLSVAFLGVCFIFLDTPPTFIAGDWMVLGAGFLLSITQIFSKFLVRTLSPFQILIWQMIYGVPILLFLSALWEKDSTFHLTPWVLLSLLYQSLGVTLFLIWLHLLRRFSASRLSVFQFSVPLFGVLLSWMILGESVSLSFGLGAALVAAGICLVSTAPQSISKLKPKPASTSTQS